MCTHRFLDAVRRALEVHVDAAGPEVARRVLQLEDLGGLRTEDLAALLARVRPVVGRSGPVALVWRSRPPSALFRAVGDLLEVVDVRLDVVDVSQDGAPVGG